MKQTKPILIINIGDEKKGWIPSKDTFDATIKLFQNSSLPENFKIIILPYYIKILPIVTESMVTELGLSFIKKSRKYSKAPTTLVILNTDNFIPSKSYIQNLEKEVYKTEYYRDNPTFFIFYHYAITVQMSKVFIEELDKYSTDSAEFGLIIMDEKDFKDKYNLHHVVK